MKLRFGLSCLMSLVALHLTSSIVSSNAELYHLCYTVQSNSSSPFHPWSVAVQGIVNTTGAAFVPSLTRVSVAQGGNRTTRLTAGFTGSRTQIDQFGVTSVVNLTTCGSDRSQLGNDDYLYDTAPYLDYHGMCLTVTNVSSSHYMTLSNNQPTDYILLYTNLPRTNYFREYLSDLPVNAQTVVTPYNASLPTSPCVPPVVTDPLPQVLKWQFCYQSYGSNWQVAMAGTISTLAHSANATSDNPSWRIISVSADRIQNMSGSVTTQYIAGLGFSNTVELASADNMLFAQAPHFSSSGTTFVSSSVFAFPNNVIPSETAMQIPMTKLGAPNGRAAFETNGPLPSWSQFAVTRFSDGYQCSTVTSSNSSSVARDSTLTPDEPPANSASGVSLIMVVMTCAITLIIFL